MDSKPVQDQTKLVIPTRNHISKRQLEFKVHLKKVKNFRRFYANKSEIPNQYKKGLKHGQIPLSQIISTPSFDNSMQMNGQEDKKQKNGSIEIIQAAQCKTFREFESPFGTKSHVLFEENNKEELDLELQPITGSFNFEEQSDCDLLDDVDEHFLSLDSPRVQNQRPVKRRSPKMGIFGEDNNYVEQESKISEEKQQHFSDIVEDVMQQIQLQKDICNDKKYHRENQSSRSGPESITEKESFDQTDDFVEKSIKLQNFDTYYQPDSIFYNHYQKYKKTKAQTTNSHTAINIKSLVNIYQNNYLRIKKYKYAMTKQNQQGYFLESYIHISRDGKTLEIINKDLAVPPGEITKDDIISMRASNKAILRRELPYDEKFMHYKSLASCCDFDDIKGFTYGGMTSRFWMLRKQLIMYDIVDRLTNRVVPFFTWECLTLHLHNRDVFLVIRDERHMENILKILISKLNTIDGSKNSAEGLKKQLYLQKGQIEVDQLLVGQTYKKYKLLKIRQKISYEAYVQKKTVQELIINRIYQTYRQMVEYKMIKPKLDDEEIESTFDKITDNKSGGCFAELIKIYEHQKGNCLSKNNKVKLKYKPSYLNKNKCSYIFQDCKMDGTRGNHKKQPDRKVLKNQIKTSELNNLYLRLKLIVEMRAVQDELFLKVMLRLIEVSKEILIHDVSTVGQAFIPFELRTDSLPASFRFYHCIANIILHDIGDEVKENIVMKSELSMRENKLIKKIKTLKNKKSQTLYPIVHETQKDEINPFQCKHAMTLQNSRYIEICQDLKDYCAHHNNSKRQPANQVFYVKFWHPAVIRRNRKDLIMLKAQFLLKLIQQNYRHRKLLVLWRVHDWLDANIDHLFSIDRQELETYAIKHDQFYIPGIHLNDYGFDPLNNKVLFKQHIYNLIEKQINHKSFCSYYKKVSELQEWVNESEDFHAANHKIEIAIEKCMNKSVHNYRKNLLRRTKFFSKNYLLG